MLPFLVEEAAALALAPEKLAYVLQTAASIGAGVLHTKSGVLEVHPGELKNAAGGRAISTSIP